MSKRTIKEYEKKAFGKVLNVAPGEGKTMRVTDGKRIDAAAINFEIDRRVERALSVKECNAKLDSPAMGYKASGPNPDYHLERINNAKPSELRGMALDYAAQAVRFSALLKKAEETSTRYAELLDIHSKYLRVLSEQARKY